MDGSTVAIIAITGVGITIVCATTFVWATAPRLDDWQPEETLGADAYIHASHRVGFLPVDDPAPGLVAKQGRRALFHSRAKRAWRLRRF